MSKQFYFKQFSPTYVQFQCQNIVLFDLQIRLSCATIPSLSGPGSDGIKGVLCIPQKSIITGAPTSDCLVS